MNFQIPNDFRESAVILTQNKEIRDRVLRCLTELGLDASTHENPEEAVSAVESARPFLLVCDSDFQIGDRAKGASATTRTLLIENENSSAPSSVPTPHVADGSLRFPFQQSQLEEAIAGILKKRLDELETDRAENEEILQLFAEEAESILTDCDKLILRLESVPVDPVTIDDLFRRIHTIKGGAASVTGGKELASLGHEFESALSKVKAGTLQPSAGMVDAFLKAYDLCEQLVRGLRDHHEVTQALSDSINACKEALASLTNGANPAPEQETPTPAAKAPSEAAHDSEDEGVWVSNEKLDALMALAGQLVVFKNNFQMITRTRDFDAKTLELSQTLTKTTDQLQEEIAAVRKISLSRAFGKMPRMVRQIGRQLGKDVRLISDGLELSVDKSIAKVLTGCMTHLIRNAMDHGIERPELRTQRYKTPQGVLRVSAADQKGLIQLRIGDDGNGIDRTKVLEKATKLGLVTQEQASQLQDAEVFDLIFRPGFSTAETISDVSGRGVGMDFVKASVTELNGRVKIESKPGAGTEFIIEIPAFRSVIVEQTILAESEGTMLAIPLQDIAEMVSGQSTQEGEVRDLRTTQFSKRTIRIGSYPELLGVRKRSESDSKSSTGDLIVLRHKGALLGLTIDRIHGQLEAVVQPFPRISQNLCGFRGTTVLGDDRVAYVMAVDEFVKTALHLDNALGAA